MYPGTLKESYEERNKLSADLKAIRESLKPGESLDEERSKQVDQMLTDHLGIVKHIDTLEKLDKVNTEMLLNQEEKKEVKKQTLDLDKTFEKFIRYGIGNLNQEEIALLQGRAVTDPQSTTSTAGGYLIPYGFNAAIDVAMKPYASVLEAAEIMSTSEGNTLYWPTVDDTSVKGHLLTEGSQDTVVKETFGQVIFYAWMFTSYIVKIPLQLLQDSAIDITGLTAQLLGERIGRVLSDYFTTGTGSSEPQGIVTVAAVANMTKPSAAAITRYNILDLKHSVNVLYRNAPGAAWMFNDDTFKAIAKLTIGTNDDRPLWQPSIIGGQPDLLEGKKYFINDSMANVGAGAKSMIFGDLKKFKIRRVLGTQLFVYREKYMDYLQIGFQAYNRWDFRMVDSGQHPVVYMVHANT